MTQAMALALVIASIAAAPLAAWWLARRGGVTAALAVVAGFAGLAPFVLVNFRPDLVAWAVEDSDLAILYPSIAGAPAVALLVALGMLTTPQNRRGVFLFAGIVAAYSIWEGSSLVRDPAAALQTGRWEGDCFMQSTNWSCAPASACTLLKRLDIEADEKEMARLMCSRPQYGTNTIQIQRGLAKKLAGRGLRATIRYLDYDGLVAAKAPGIASIELMFMLDHAVALIEAKPEGVVILDPLVGRREIERAHFETIWRRHIVLVLPAPGR